LRKNFFYQEGEGGKRGAEVEKAKRGKTSKKGGEEGGCEGWETSLTKMVVHPCKGKSGSAAFWGYAAILKLRVPEVSKGKLQTELKGTSSSFTGGGGRI